MAVVKDIPCFRCSRCFSTFEFDKSDVKEIKEAIRENVGTILPIYREVNYKIRYVECPVCGYKCEIYREEE